MQDGGVGTSALGQGCQEHQELWPRVEVRVARDEQGPNHGIQKASYVIKCGTNLGRGRRICKTAGWVLPLSAKAAKNTKSCGRGRMSARQETSSRSNLGSEKTTDVIKCGVGGDDDDGLWLLCYC